MLIKIKKGKIFPTELGKCTVPSITIGYVDHSSFLSSTTLRYEIFIKNEGNTWKDLCKNSCLYTFFASMMP
jgi:hypothetical protein